MAFPVIRNTEVSGRGSVAGTTHSASIPTHEVDDLILVLFIAARAADIEDFVLTDDYAFTLVKSDFTAGFFYRFADDTAQTAASSETPTISCRPQFLAYSISGVPRGVPLEFNFIESPTGVNTLTPTWGAADSLFVGWVNAANGLSDFTLASALEGRIRKTSASSSNSFHVAGVFGHKATAVASFTTDDWVATTGGTTHTCHALVAVPPVGTGGPARRPSGLLMPF